MKQSEIKKWLTRGIVSKSKSIEALAEIDNPTVNMLLHKAEGYKQALEDVRDMINNDMEAE